jgi:hypothetical protein
MISESIPRVMEANGGLEAGVTRFDLQFQVIILVAVGGQEIKNESQKAT